MGSKMRFRSLCGVNKTFSYKKLSQMKHILWALVLLFAAGQVAAQASIEFDSSGSAANAATNVTTMSVTMKQNTNNPGGTTFGTVPTAPQPVATFAFSNQRYTSVPTQTTSTQTGAFFGLPAPTEGTIYYPLNSIGAPQDWHFSSLPTTIGSGISVASNYGARVMLSGSALAFANVAQSGRFAMADLTITFNRPITNPIIHFSGLGGAIGSKGFSAEADFLTVNVECPQ